MIWVMDFLETRVLCPRNPVLPLFSLPQLPRHVLAVLGILLQKISLHIQGERVDIFHTLSSYHPGRKHTKSAGYRLEIP